MPYCFKVKDPVTNEILFLEVVNSCTHHFTGERMRFVRMHGEHNGAYCVYHFLNEKEWAEFLNNRIMEDTADSGDVRA